MAGQKLGGEFNNNNADFYNQQICITQQQNTTITHYLSLSWDEKHITRPEQGDKDTEI